MWILEARYIETPEEIERGVEFNWFRLGCSQFRGILEMCKDDLIEEFEAKNSNENIRCEYRVVHNDEQEKG